jgi:hypothetical protein
LLVVSLAATYLTVEADGDDALRDDFRGRAIVALVAAGAASWGALLASRGSAPALFARVVVEGAVLMT